MKRQTGLGSIFLVLFADLIGFSILFPLFPSMLTWYGAHDNGLLAWSMEQAQRLIPVSDPNQRAALFGGLIGAVYAGLQFLVAPTWGRLSDRFGRRPILLISLLGSVLSNLLWVFAGNFTLLLLSRVLSGAMSGNTAVANAAVADISTPENRSKGMAAVGMAFGLGFIVGPILGSLFSNVYYPTQEGGLNPFSVPATIAFGLAVVNLVWVWKSFAETLPVERRMVTVDGGRTANPFRIFRNDLPVQVHTINFAGCLYTFFFAGMEATLGFIAAQQLGMPASVLGFLFAWTGVVSAAMQGLVFRKYGQVWGVARLTAYGFAAQSIGLAMVALVDYYPSHALLWGGMTVQSIGIGLVFPGLSTLVSLAAPADRQGFAMGTFRSAGSLGRALGPLLAGVAYYLIAPSAPYWIAALGMLIPLFLVIRLKQ